MLKKIIRKIRIKREVNQNWQVRLLIELLKPTDVNIKHYKNRLSLFLVKNDLKMTDLRLLFSSYIGKLAWFDFDNTNNTVVVNITTRDSNGYNTITSKTVDRFSMTYYVKKDELALADETQVMLVVAQTRQIIHADTPFDGKLLNIDDYMLPTGKYFNR